MHGQKNIKLYNREVCCFYIANSNGDNLENF